MGILWSKPAPEPVGFDATRYGHTRDDSAGLALEREPSPAADGQMQWQPDQQAVWVPDYAHRECMLCKMTFGWFARRHREYTLHQHADAALGFPAGRAPEDFLRRLGTRAVGATQVLWSCNFNSAEIALLFVQGCGDSPSTHALIAHDSRRRISLFDRLCSLRPRCVRICLQIVVNADHSSVKNAVRIVLWLADT